MLQFISTTAPLSADRLARDDQRRVAFETRLAAQLAEALGPAPNDPARAELVAAIGKAYGQERHMIEARALVGRDARRTYLVLQAGLRLGDSELGAPFAEGVLDRARKGGLDIADPAPILRAIGAAEISDRHAIDHRKVIRTPWFAVYWVLVGGRDRRAQEHYAVSTERRAPARRLLSALFFFGLGGVLASIAFAVIGMAIFALNTLLAAW